MLISAANPGDFNIMGRQDFETRARPAGEGNGPADGKEKLMSDIITAGILVIGDEILSGRTKDKNIGFIAEYLTNIGIDLKEVRVVSDDEADIIAALNALRATLYLCLHHGRHRPDP